MQKRSQGSEPGADSVSRKQGQDLTLATSHHTVALAAQKQKPDSCVQPVLGL